MKPLKIAKIAFNYTRKNNIHNYNLTNNGEVRRFVIKIKLGFMNYLESKLKNTKNKYKTKATNSHRRKF